MRAGNIHLKQMFSIIRMKLLILIFSIFAFILLFSVLGTSVKLNQNMHQDMKQMPEIARKMMGEGFAESVIKFGIITVGYIHPATLTFFIVFILMTISQIVTSEISSGTIGFTLSKPISRKRLFLNLGIITYAGLGLISLSAFLASWLGILIFHSGKFSPAPFVTISWNLFLLMIFIAGYLFLFAAISDTGKKMYSYGGITIFLFYLLNMALPLWKPLNLIAPVNPFSYYKPMALLTGARIDVTTATGILAISLAMFMAAMMIFNRRDIAGG